MSASDNESEIHRRRREREAALRARRRRRWMSAFIVVAPVVCALVYAMNIATPRYEAESRFFVQSGSNQQAGGVGAASLLTTGNGGGMLGGFVDGWAVKDFLMSRDSMRQLDQKVGLRQYLVNPGLDPANHLSTDASEDALYRAYQSSVQVSFNALEQIDVLRVSAFSSEDAELLSKALINLAEDFVSRLNEKGVADKLKVSQDSLTRAERKAMEARDALTQWRTTHGNIDPTATVSMLLNLSSTLESELNSAQINYDKIRALGNPNHPMLQPARLQITALKKRLAEVRQRLSGQGNTEAKLLKSYEALRNAQAFADSNLTLAQQSYQQALADTLRLQRYLSIIAQPVPTDTPSSPRMMILLLEALALGFALLFVVRVAMSMLKGLRHG
ncbi:MPA2 protein component of an ABC-type polysaccharide export system [Bordetella ansorpii]|uniref:MPA2 protein component of an ABC-type polysaccharide export system n=1 Tax=Bordetella ansorpii TaxID=288768 RepID=A0A157L5A3_9BORD|nr:sugar ABC transporter [Bordetella ansorpii]SAH91847.1 MPA2 protein component of an ABC-type polysaccharide export system [Bordetella ansorpii]